MLGGCGAHTLAGPDPQLPGATMTKFRFALAGVLAAAALGGPAAPVNAHDGKQERCEHKLESLEERFHRIEARVGWEAASVWWNEVGWPRYYAHCGGS